MTKVLIITNTTDFTSDYIVHSLDAINADYYRLNTDEIGSTIFLTFDFDQDKYAIFDRPKAQTIDILSFTSVYFRRPDLPSFQDTTLTNDERQFMILEVRQTLEGLYKILKNAYWISDIDAIRKAENKIYQQLIAKEIGFKAPAGIVTNQPEEFLRFVEKNNNDCIVKPIYSGQIGWPETKQVVFTSKLDGMPSNQQVEACPTYIQKRIEKKYDIRVTVVEDKIFAARIHSQSNPQTQTDWREGDNLLEHEIIAIPDTLANQCRQLLKQLNLRFGAIDFIETQDNQFIFLEINPNGQWAWIQIQTGMPISDAIAQSLTNEHFS